MNSLDVLENKTLEWSANKGILKNGRAETQVLKLMSELGELADNIIKGNDVKDDIGDCLVVLTNIANLSGTNLAESWAVAYDDIKDRTGFLNSSGTFIKDTDKNYKQLFMEFTNELH